MLLQLTRRLKRGLQPRLPESLGARAPSRTAADDCAQGSRRCSAVRGASYCAGFSGKSSTTLLLPRGVSAEEVEQQCCNNRPDA